jgi:hypothetical protein
LGVPAFCLVFQEKETPRLVAAYKLLQQLKFSDRVILSEAKNLAFSIS